MVYGDWFSRTGGATLPLGKSADAGMTGGGRWVTIDGNHVFISDGGGHGDHPRHRADGRTPLTRAAFEADVRRGPDTFFRGQLRMKEHGNRTDPAQDNDRTHGPLGHYQFLDSTLIDLGLKRRRGDHGWGDTPFAAAYGIRTNQDFLNSDAAQDAALAQFARRAESEIAPLQQYIGHRYLTAEGDPVTVTHAGLFAAIHKQGGQAVRDYFKEYGRMILSDVEGEGLGQTRAYDETNNDDNDDRNVEERLHWAQYIHYQPQW